ncbi:MAG: thiamine diphosphokinase [Anaerolineae bacterium]
MRAVILSNGPLEDTVVLRKRLAPVTIDLVIGADAGSFHAAALGLRLDMVVGDMDSLHEHGETLPGDAALIASPAEKDETDLELALLEAVRCGADELVLLGVMGGRLDMALANILLLLHPALDGVRVFIWHGQQTAWLIRPPGGVIRGRPGDTLSLIPLGAAVEGITTNGLRYPLKDEALLLGPARGLSNVLTEPSAQVDVRNGLLLAVHTPGRA